MSDRPTILIVDDTPDNIALLNGLLKESYRTKIATGGEKALRIAQTAPPPDLVLLDVMMPEMDGYMLTTEIRRDQQLQKLCVILHTSLSGNFNKAMVKKVGCNGFLSKFAPERFAAEVQRVIRERLDGKEQILD